MLTRRPPLALQAPPAIPSRSSRAGCEPLFAPSTPRRPATAPTSPTAPTAAPTSRSSSPIRRTAASSRSGRRASSSRRARASSSRSRRATRRAQPSSFTTSRPIATRRRSTGPTPSGSAASTRTGCSSRLCRGAALCSTSSTCSSPCSAALADLLKSGDPLVAPHEVSLAPSTACCHAK